MKTITINESPLSQQDTPQKGQSLPAQEMGCLVGSSRLLYETKNKFPEDLSNTKTLSIFCSMHTVRLFDLALP